METITIINKSGKVMSTSKHLVSIFKDAKLAYQEKKAEFREERRVRDEEKMAQRLLTERVRMSDVRSQASSHRSHRSTSHARTRGVEEGGGGVKDRRRPPLTIENLSQFTEGSVASSPSRRGSRKGSDHGGPRSPQNNGYQKPYMEDALTSRPSLVRRHTDQSFEPHLISRRPTLPEMHTSPDLSQKPQKPIDMDLAYGEMHKSHIPPTPEQKELELQQQMSRLDSLLLEAQCIGHSATTIIQALQKNPEAMAAVALTLAEISNLVKIMSPSILTAIKGSSPAIFALLICPEFLIGTGLAVGVTIVMFGGYKIIKKIQANNAAALQKEAPIPAKVDAEGNQMDEAIVYNGDLSSVETWMRGVEESQIGEGSVATSVEGEFITPEAASIRKMRAKDRIALRAREERSYPPSTVGSGSEYSYTAPNRGSSRRSRSVVTDQTRRSRGGGTNGNGKEKERDREVESEAEMAERRGRKMEEKEKSKSKSEKKDRGKEKGKEKEKKPSVLKVLFKGKSEKVKMVGA